LAGENFKTSTKNNSISFFMRLEFKSNLGLFFIEKHKGLIYTIKLILKRR
jgi:hypothetical protein